MGFMWILTDQTIAHGILLLEKFLSNCREDVGYIGATSNIYGHLYRTVLQGGPWPEASYKCFYEHQNEIRVTVQAQCRYFEGVMLSPLLQRISCILLSQLVLMRSFNLQ